MAVTAEDIAVEIKLAGLLRNKRYKRYFSRFNICPDSWFRTIKSMLSEKE
jgi:hypothetical protein